MIIIMTLLLLLPLLLLLMMMIMMMNFDEHTCRLLFFLCLVPRVLVHWLCVRGE